MSGTSFVHVTVDASCMLLPNPLRVVRFVLAVLTIICGMASVAVF